MNNIKIEENKNKMLIIPAFISKKGPLFHEKIYITRPNLPSMEELLPKIQRMLDKRWVTNFGDFHNELEKKLQKVLNVKHVVLCCNGTIGLFLLLKALNLKGRVITSAFTFPATIHAICMAGLEPVFCDIDPCTYVLSPKSVKSNIDSSVSAILSVNVFGNTSQVEEIDNIGKEYNLPVLYDSAHAFLCSYKNKPAGGFGRAEMFSFHATKLFTTLEGGAIATNDTDLFRRLKLLINFGIKNEESIVDIGMNAKMSEINAIFGILSLKKMKSVVKKLAILSDMYKKRLSKIPGIKFQQISKECLTNNQYMPIEIDSSLFGLNRNMLHAVLKCDNIIARKYFYPAGHQYECYKDMGFAAHPNLPNTEAIADKILCLPIYESLSTDSIDKICSLIESIYFYRKEIATNL